jgi:hypothetical protein
VAFLTVAQGYKFAGGSQPHFADLAIRLLRAAPNAHLILVGPGNVDPVWMQLETAYTNQVHLFEILDDTADLLVAADAYLDSFPFSSITAALDAALSGLPVLSFQPDEESPLRFDDFAVYPRIVTTADDWVAVTKEWSDEGDLRRLAGSRMQAEAIRGHTGTTWKEQATVAYQDVTAGAATFPLRVDGHVDHRDIDLLRLHAQGGLSRDVGTLVQSHGLSLEGTNAHFERTD